MRSTSQIFLSTSTVFYLLSSPLAAMDGEEMNTEWEEGMSVIPVKSESMITELEDHLIDKRELKASKGKKTEEAEMVVLPGNAIKVKPSALGKDLIKYNISNLSHCSSVTVTYKMRAKGVDFQISAWGEGEKLPLRNHGGALSKTVLPGTLPRQGKLIFEPQGRKTFDLVVSSGEDITHTADVASEILIYNMEVTGLYKPILTTTAETPIFAAGVPEPDVSPSILSTTSSWIHWASLGFLGTPTTPVGAIDNDNGVKKLGDGLVRKERALQAKEGKGSEKTTINHYSNGVIKVGSSDPSKDYAVKYDLSEFRDADTIRVYYAMQTPQGAPLEISVLGDADFFPFEDLVHDKGWNHVKLSIPPSPTTQKGAIIFYPQKLKTLEFVVGKSAKTVKSLGDTVIHDMHIQALYKSVTKTSEKEESASPATS